jgi:hypothetical protein
METRNEYQQMLDLQLAELSHQITLIDTKVENTSTDEQVKYVQELDVLYTKFRDLTFKLKQLKNASDDNWKTIKLTPEELWGRRSASLSVKSRSDIESRESR